MLYGEPSLDELLSEPVIQRRMQVDGDTVPAVEALRTTIEAFRGMASDDLSAQAVREAARQIAAIAEEIEREHHTRLTQARSRRPGDRG